MINKKKMGGMSKRYAASYQTRNQGGGGNKGIFKWDGVEHNFFTPAPGTNRINIVPYEIKTKNHPLVKSGEFDVGDFDYVLDVHTHRNIGAGEVSVVCLKKTYSKPCPICEQADLFRQQGKEKEANAFKASRRVIYNIEDIKNKPGEILVFDASHFLFEKELIDEARESAEGEGFIPFADIENGKEIKFRCGKISRGGMEFNEFKSFQFIDRDEPLSEKLLEKAISLDEVLSVPTYEQVQKMLFGEDESEEDDEDEEEKPVKNLASKAEEKDDEEDEEQEEEEEKPVKKQPAKKEPVKADGKCPFGHSWKTDWDSTSDCDDCDEWATCGKK